MCALNKKYARSIELKDWRDVTHGADESEWKIRVYMDMNVKVQSIFTLKYGQATICITYSYDENV